MILEVEDHQRGETLNFTQQLVLSVRKKLKYLSNQQGLSLFIVENVFKIKNHKIDLDKKEDLLVVLGVNQVIGRLTGLQQELEIETEDHLTEDHQREGTLNFILQFVLSARKKLRYLSSPQGLSLFSAESVFKTK